MLELKDIAFSYPKGEFLFDNLNLCLEDKGLVHIKGENGSGKTTLLKIISALITPPKGEVKFKDSPLNSEHCSYMPAQPESTFLQLTGRETLEFFSSLNGSTWFGNPYRLSLEGLATFQKAAKTKQLFCSTGMKQIINFARTLTKEAEVYLFDEPLKGLDKESRKEVLSIIQDLADNKLVLLTGHEDLSIHAQRVITSPFTGVGRA